MLHSSSSLSGAANFVYNLDIGKFYFFDNVIVTEIFEGVIMGEKEFAEINDLVLKHFDITKPYGLISHRLYSYSINLSELIPIANQFGMLVVNAVVTYSSISLKTFELEQRLLKFKGETFFNMKDAFEWISLQVENTVKANEHN
jgi:hypothetical protein